MKSLLILRHAKSSWKHQELTDHDRPLNKRGKKDAARMGKLLKKENLIPDLIISSTHLALFFLVMIIQILVVCYVDDD